MNVTLPLLFCCFTRLLVSFAGKSPSQYYWNFINLNQRKEGKRGDPEMQRRLHEYHLIIFIKLHFAYFVWARDRRSENIDTGNYFHRMQINHLQTGRHPTVHSSNSQNCVLLCILLELGIKCFLLFMQTIQRLCTRKQKWKHCIWQSHLIISKQFFFKVMAMLGPENGKTKCESVSMHFQYKRS